MSDAPKFELRESDHVYLLDDVRILGTTEILRACGIIDSTWFNPGAAIRGRAVHAACHYLAEGDLDRETLAVELRGYVDAYESAMEALDFYPDKCEIPQYHPLYKYGTKIDQIGVIASRDPSIRGSDAIVELKTGIMQDWTRLQTAFQTMAWWPKDYYKIPRFGVELKDDGKFRVEHYSDPEDFDDALGMYLTATWKRKYKIGDFKNGL